MTNQCVKRGGNHCNTHALMVYICNSSFMHSSSVFLCHSLHVGHANDVNVTSYESSLMVSCNTLTERYRYLLYLMVFFITIHSITKCVASAILLPSLCVCRDQRIIIYHKLCKPRCKGPISGPCGILTCYRLMSLQTCLGRP